MVLAHRVPTADSDRPRMFPDGTKPKMFSSSKKKIFPIITDQEQNQEPQQGNEQQQDLTISNVQGTVSSTQDTASSIQGAVNKATK